MSGEIQSPIHDPGREDCEHRSKVEDFKVRIESTVNRFIPPELLKNPDDRHAAQRTLYFAAAAWGVSPGFALTYALLYDTLLLTWIVLGFMVAVLLTPYFLWISCRPVVAAHWFAFCGWALLTSATLVAGGLHAPGIYWQPLLPCVVVLLAGRKAGITWGCITAVSVTMLTVLDIAGWLPPDPLGRTEGLGITGVVVVVGTFLGVYLAILYESQRVAAVSELAMERKRFAYQAMHDSLTDLPNRALFEDRLERAVERSKRSGKYFAIIYLDLDDFKGINDRLGHDAGDNLLKEVAIRLTRGLRGSDTVARLGGDEFILILEEVNDRSDVEGVLTKLGNLLQGTISLDGTEIRCSCSMGMALWPEDAHDIKSLIRIADLAMYQNKRQSQPETIQ